MEQLLTFFQATIKESDPAEDDEDVEINEAALETGILNLFRVIRDTRQEKMFRDEQLEDAEGTDYKRIKGTDFYYSKGLKLIVDPETKVPLKQLDDVELYRILNNTKGANLLISVSP